MEPLSRFHRVILASDFMERIAPLIWPPEERVGFCYQLDRAPECQLTEGEVSSFYGVYFENVTGWNQNQSFFVFSCMAKDTSCVTIHLPGLPFSF